MSGRFRWKKQPQMGAGAGKVSEEKVAADGGAKPVEKQRARTLEMKRMAKLVPELRATAANVNPGLFEISEADSETAVDQLRAFMCACSEAIASAQSALDILLASGETPHATSRAGFLRSLPELIGPPPERSWQDEWEPMMIRSLSLTKGEEQYANAEFVQKNESIAKWKLRLEEYVASLVRRGWPFEQARILRDDRVAREHLNSRFRRAAIACLNMAEQRDFHSHYSLSACTFHATSMHFLACP
eukprot:6208188-Pleurochrysis_carterae.AAC.8